MKLAELEAAFAVLGPMVPVRRVLVAGFEKPIYGEQAWGPASQQLLREAVKRVLVDDFEKPIYGEQAWGPASQQRFLREAWRDRDLPTVDKILDYLEPRRVEEAQVLGMDQGASWSTIAERRLPDELPAFAPPAEETSPPPAFSTGLEDGTHASTTGEKLASPQPRSRKTQMDDRDFRQAVRRMLAHYSKDDGLSSQEQRRAKALADTKGQLEKEGRMTRRLAERLDVADDGRQLIYWFPKLEAWDEKHRGEV